MVVIKQCEIKIIERLNSLKAEILKIRNLLDEILTDWKLQEKKIFKVKHMGRKITQTDM